MAKKDFMAKLTTERQSIVKEMLENTEQTKLELPEEKGETKRISRTPNTREASEGTKSRRVNVLFTQEIYNGLSAIATMQRQSVNETINRAASEYIRQHEAEIEQYNVVFSKGEK